MNGSNRATANLSPRIRTHFWRNGALALGVLAWAAIALAGDIDSAKRQVEKVKVDIESRTWDSAEQDIKSAEEFLDGVPDADRAPVQKELDDLKAKAMAGIKEYKSKLVLDSSKRELDSVSDDISSSPGGALERIDKVIEKLNSDDAKKYADPDQVQKLLARANSLKTMAATKAAGMKLDFAAPIVKELDDAMAAQPFKDAKSSEDLNDVTQKLGQLMSRIRGALDGVPATDPRVKAINDKLAGYQKQIDAAAGGAMAAQAAENLAQRWKAQQEYFDGWQQETQGPKWEDYTKQSSEAMDNLLMPKTIELLRRLTPWFEEDDVKAAAQQSKDNASIKATLADAHKAYDTAATKLHGALDKLLSAAEQIPTPKDDLVRTKADVLAHNADNWLKGTPFHDADVARAKALNDKWNKALAGDAAAKTAAMENLTKAATAAWPGIASTIKAEEGFTPDKLDQFKGKTIHLKGNNRLGYDYSPGDYDFARDINGMPVAGRFDPNVTSAYKEVGRQTGQDVPDAAWDLYAVVEGPGSIQRRSQEEGKVKVNGTEVGTVTAERHVPVPCAVIRIIALHAGPLAVGPSGSAVAGSSTATPTASGSPGTPVAAANPPGTPPAASSGSHWLIHIGELVLCLAGAGLVMLKARPVPALQTAGATEVSPADNLASDQNLALAGLALAALGVIWLLWKLVIGDLLPALSLTLAGVYVAADWLKARKILPPALAEAIKPFGLPIAGAAAVFGVLHLFLGQWAFF